MIRNVLAVASFLSVLVGLWLIYPPLAPLLGGGFVLACLVHSHVRGKVE